MSGGTCSFMEGGTSFAVFCENGCCSNQCCSEDIDFTALYICLAVIIGFLLLLALIALITYCCLRRKKRKKGEWRDNLVRQRNDVVPLSVITTDANKHGRDRKSSSSSSSSSHSAATSYFNHAHFQPVVSSYPPARRGHAHKAVQTTNPNPAVNDKTLGGRSKRWSSYNPRAKPVPKKSRPARTTQASTQTSQDRPGIITPSDYWNDHYRLSTAPPSSYLDDNMRSADKFVQTPRSYSSLHDPNREARDRNRQYTPSYGAKKPEQRKRMWLPAPQHNSLKPRIPSGPTDQFPSNR